MTTFYDNRALDDEPMEFLLIDGRPAFRRLGPDVPYKAKYEVAETVDRPKARPCVPLPVCLDQPAFADVPLEVLGAPLTGAALPIDSGYPIASYGGTWGFGAPYGYFSEPAADVDLSFSPDLMSVKQGRFDVEAVIFAAKHQDVTFLGHGVTPPAPVPLPAGFGLLIAALVCVAAVRRKK